MSRLTALIQTMATERRTLVKRQDALIHTLNQVLPGIGYRVTPIDAPHGSVASSTERPRSPQRAKSLLCPHCPRRFSLALHLGRHVSATHKKNGSPPASDGANNRTKRRNRNPSKRRKAAKRST
jgi:hypothetical protein